MYECHLYRRHCESCKLLQMNDGHICNLFCICSDVSCAGFIADSAELNQLHHVYVQTELYFLLYSLLDLYAFAGGD